MRCQAFWCVGSFEERPCENGAGRFFLTPGGLGILSDGAFVAVCDEHVHIWSDCEEITEAEASVIKTHEE